MRLSCLLLQCALLVGNLTPVLWFSANKTGKKKKKKLKVPSKMHFLRNV